jgi:hypothetical protein
MRLLHSAANTSAQFDDPNLVSCAGLVPVMRLAQDCDLAGLVAEHLKGDRAGRREGAPEDLRAPGGPPVTIPARLAHRGRDQLMSFLRGFDAGCRRLIHGPGPQRALPVAREIPRSDYRL